MKYIDPTGGFPIKIHKEMLSGAMLGTGLNKSAQKSMLHGTGNRADLGNMFKSGVHLDGLTNFNAVSAGYNGAVTNFESSMASGDYSDAGMALHTIGDFYSHSNYMDIFEQYADDSKITLDINNIPTFDEAMAIPELKGMLEKRLKTGTYNALNDKFTNDQEAHGNMNVDANKGNGANPFGKTGATRHEAARRVAEKDINNRVKQHAPKSIE